MAATDEVTDNSALFDVDGFFTEIEEQAHDASSAETSRLGGNIKNSEWMCNYLSHPLKENAKWSFLHHEYQIGIVDSEAPRRSVIKCSQSGVSQISVNLSYAIILRNPRIRVIYTMPTKMDMERFVADRFNTMLEDSRFLRSRIDKSINNLTMKKFINKSFLYALGTEGKGAGISVPAPVIIKDEVDFSNQLILKRLASRQAHWDESEIINMEFSTPTVPNFGIAKAYDQSSQALFAVKCDHCSTWQLPKFESDVIVPGFDSDILSWSETELSKPSVKVDEAYVKCPGCHKPLSAENMINPEKRQWVHAYESRREKHEGWRVQPIDVYAINPPSRTLRQVEDYETKAEYVNFRLGAPYIDSNSRLRAPIQVSKLDVVIDKSRGYFIGGDVGRMSWVMVGAYNTDGRLVLILKEQIKNVIDSVTGQSSVLTRVKELAEEYHIDRTVVDSFPDLTLSASIAFFFKEGYLAEYKTRAPEVGSFVSFKDEKQLVHIFRTEGFNLLAGKLSNGQILEIQSDETPVVQNHLSNFVRVVREGKTFWLKTGDDHYAHALLYLAVAAGFLDSLFRHKVMSTKEVFTPLKKSGRLKRNSKNLNIQV